MFHPRVRWLINSAMIVAAIAFIGISVLPLFSTNFKESQPSSQALPTPSQTLITEQQAKLQAEARSYSIVLQQEPENPTALQGLAVAKIRLGDLNGAIAPLEKLVVLEPNQYEYTRVLGQVYAKQKNYEAAIAAYDRAIQFNEEDYRPVLEKATLLKQQGKTEQAERLFQKAAALAPADSKEQIKQQANETPNVPEKQKEQGE